MPQPGTPSHPAGPRPTSPRPTRRSVLTATAWTVPAIAVAAPAPAFAASPCAPVPFPTNWTAANPASGGLTGAASDNGYTTAYAAGGVNTYLSVRDNSSTAISSNTGNDATVTLQTTLNLVVGRAYTFVFTIASQHGSNNPSGSQLQLLDITIGGTNVGRYATQTSAPAGSTDPIKATRAAGYTRLNTSAAGITTQTVTATFTPTAASNVLRYLWTLPARGYNPLVIVGTPQSTYTSGSDDIAVSAPTISGC